VNGEEVINSDTGEPLEYKPMAVKLQFDKGDTNMKTAGARMYKYADVEKDEKVKFAINVFGLVKTENGWEKFWLVDTVGKPEYRLEEDFQDEVRKSKKASWNYIVELNTNEDPTSPGNYHRKLIIKGELDAETSSKSYSFRILHYSR
jgi:hypothetical protein